MTMVSQLSGQYAERGLKTNEKRKKEKTELRGYEKLFTKFISFEA